ncbi:MAG TPA: hypothetical protein VN915_06950 [Elusimicrobiota bacterium]|nr:hypothetical protein [Elusimicrobiota bacterium]
MTTRALALLLVALALPAAAQRVEVVPEGVIPSAPGASAVSAAPTASLAPALSPAALAVSAPFQAAPIAAISAAPAAPVAAAGVAAVPALAAAPSAAAAAQPAVPPGLALVPAAAKPVPGKTDSAAVLSEAAAGSVKFDGAREHEGSAVDAVPASAEPSRPALKALGPSKKAPGDAERMAQRLIPAWIKEELPVTAAKLGRAAPADYLARVLSRSDVWVYKWHSRWTYEVSGGLPDGHFDPKFGIRVMLKLDWRKLKDPKTHFKVLYAHEYTHWLQDEGLITYRYGVEIPAVAVEQLRAMELVGWEGMKAGRVGFIAESNLRSFEHGREWARGDMKDATILYYRGVLGGAAYEVGRIAGRPEAAWEFLNLVVAEKGGLSPREAFERVTGLKK